MVRIAGAAVLIVAVIVVSRYLVRSVMAGKILVAIRGGNETWFVREVDPVSFWIVVCLVSVVDMLLVIPAIQAATMN
jgi:hypothetical protein